MNANSSDRSSQSASKQEGGEPSDEEAAQPFYDLAWKTGARRTVSFAGDELESVSFGPAEFEAFCTALSAPPPPLAGAGEAAHHTCDESSECEPCDAMAQRGLFESKAAAFGMEVLRITAQPDSPYWKIETQFAWECWNRAAALNPKPAPLNGGDA